MAAITYGRQAALYIRRLFPDFYAAHVAHLPTTVVLLLGVVQAFFSLAQQRLWLDHSYELTIDPRNPLRVLHPSLSDAEALGRLEEFHGWGLDEVYPEVYGILAEEDALFDEGRNLLIAVLWYVADRTAWSATMFDMEEAIDDWLSQAAISPAGARQLEHLPQLGRDTDMDALCATLSTQPDVLPADLHSVLGQVVRYVFGRTGNWFADISTDELAEMSGSGIDWLHDDLDAVAAEQAEARRLFEQYRTLNTFVTTNPDAIETIVAVIMQAAVNCPTNTPS